MNLYKVTFKSNGTLISMHASDSRDDVSKCAEAQLGSKLLERVACEKLSDAAWSFSIEDATEDDLKAFVSKGGRITEPKTALAVLVGEEPCQSIW